MEKLLKIIRLLISLVIDVIMLGGLTIVLLWLIWDVTPQTSITKTAYFFSESWAIMTGRRPSEEKPKTVRKEQLKESSERMLYIGESRK